MISAMAAPSFMTVSPWIARPVPSGRFETVGSGFGCGVKRARRVGTEVLICVLPPEGAFHKITELQAGEEFSCSQHLPERGTGSRPSGQGQGGRICEDLLALRRRLLLHPGYRHLHQAWRLSACGRYVR